MRAVCRQRAVGICAHVLVPEAVRLSPRLATDFNVHPLLLRHHFHSLESRPASAVSTGSTVQYLDPPGAQPATTGTKPLQGVLCCAHFFGAIEGSARSRQAPIAFAPAPARLTLRALPAFALCKASRLFHQRHRLQTHPHGQHPPDPENSRARQARHRLSAVHPGRQAILRRPRPPTTRIIRRCSTLLHPRVIRPERMRPDTRRCSTPHPQTIRPCNTSPHLRTANHPRRHLAAHAHLFAGLHQLHHAAKPR